MNAKRTIRFFGGAEPAPVPVGLKCVHCSAPFAFDSRGLWFERDEACYPAHPLCFANAAVRGYIASFAR